MSPTVALLYLRNLAGPYLKRRVVMTFILVFFITMFLCSGVAMAADDPHGPIKLPGMGSLFPIPDPAPGTGQTLREAYADDAWAITSEMENVGGGDTGKIMLSMLADMILFLIKLFAYCIIGMSYWIFGSTSLPGASAGTASMMSSLGQIALTQMLPITLTMAFLVAYAQVRRLDWSTAIWAVLSAVLAIGMMTGPVQVVGAVDTVRQAGMTVVASVSTGSGKHTLADPIPSPKPPIYDSKNPKTTMLRSVEDTIWRQLVATPWCMAQFGSLEACKRYGPTMLTKTSDDDRQKYIKETIYKNLSVSGNNKDEGKNSATGQFIKGEDNGGRVGLLAFCLLFVIIFGVLLLGTGLTALVGIGTSTILLGIGPFFAALWVIEGRPRQWGIGWFNLLVGAIAATVISSLLFMVALNIVGAVISTATGGWAAASMSALIILFSAFSVKNQLLGLFGAQGVSLTRMMAYGYAGQRILGGGMKSMGGLFRGGAKAASATGKLGGKAAGAAGRGAAAAGRGVGAAGTQVANVFRDPVKSGWSKPTTRKAGDPAPTPKGPAGGNKPSPTPAAAFTQSPQPSRPAGAPAGQRGPGRRAAAPNPTPTTTRRTPNGGAVRAPSNTPRYGESAAQAARRNPSTRVQDLPGQSNVATRRTTPARQAPAAPRQAQVRQAPAAARTATQATKAANSVRRATAPAAQGAKHMPAPRVQAAPTPPTEIRRERRPDRKADQ